MLNTTFDWDEVDSLITLLQMNGISYLVGNGACVNEDDKVEPAHLLQRLAACGYPLVENACISLFIVHPELASSAVEALQRSEEHIAETLSVLILATLYLQQWWIFRLTFALGRLPSFLEAPFVSLWEDRHLPPPRSGYGRDGLLALQDYQQHHYGLALNVLDDWQNQINHLLLQEEATHRELSDEVREALLQLSA
jgi:hypothetical protein